MTKWMVVNGDGGDGDERVLHVDAVVRRFEERARALRPVRPALAALTPVTLRLHVRRSLLARVRRIAHTAAHETMFQFQ